MAAHASSFAGPVKARGHKDERIIAYMPAKFEELKRVVADELGIAQPRIFIEGRKEICNEHDYRFVEAGDVLVAVDKNKAKVDVKELVRKTSKEAGRIELPPQAKKLVSFTGNTETRESYPPHPGEGRRQLLVPKGERPPRMSPGEQILAADELKKSDPKWWEGSPMQTESESAANFKGADRIELLDTREYKLKNQRSDFALFAHSYPEKQKLSFNTNSDYQDGFGNKWGEGLEALKAVPSAGYVPEKVTTTQTLPVKQSDRWWEKSPFTGVSESQSTFVDHTSAAEKDLHFEECNASKLTHTKEVLNIDTRIGLEPGSLQSSRRSSRAS